MGEGDNNFLITFVFVNSVIPRLDRGIQNRPSYQRLDSCFHRNDGNYFWVFLSALSVFICVPKGGGMLGQLIVSGLAVGFCYALLALAMVIIYKTSEVLNFARSSRYLPESTSATITAAASK